MTHPTDMSPNEIHTEPPKKGGRNSSLFILRLLPLLGAMSTVFVFMSATERIFLFDRFLMPFLVFVSWGYFTILYNIRKNSRALSVITVVSTAAVPLMLLLRFSVITQAISDFNEKFRSVFYDNVTLYTDVPPSYENTALAIIAVFITSICVYSFAQRIYLSLIVLVTAPLTLYVLFYGLVPDRAAFIGLMVFWCAAVGAKNTENSQRNYDRTSNTSLAALLMLISCIIGMSFTSLAGRSKKADEIRNNFLDCYSSFTWDKFFDDMGSSLLPTEEHRLTHDGKLGNVEEILFDGKTMLEITIPEDARTVYLKGFTGGEYNGSNWSENEFVPEMQTNITSDEFFPMRVLHEYPRYRDLEAEYMVVRNTSITPRSRYFPANAAGLIESDGMRRRYWGYFPDAAWQSYVIKNSPIQDLPPEMQSDELTLRNAAYEHYTEVPPTFTYSSTFFRGYDGDSMLDELSYIRRHLAELCDYTLLSGKKPFGKDFAQWFLEENRKGSCTHFATAAVLLCRSRGIPARYCEGFIITPDDTKDIEPEDGYISLAVPDHRAHAWAEIYVDGFGWMVFETTPGYGNILFSDEPDEAFEEPEETDISEVTSVTTEELQFEEELNATESKPVTSEEEAWAETETTEDTGAEISESDTDTDTSTETEEPRGEASETETTPSGGNAEAPDDGSRTMPAPSAPEEPHTPFTETKAFAVIMKILLIIAVIAVAVLAVIASRALIISRRIRMMNDSPEAAAVKIYRRLARLAKMSKIHLTDVNDETYRTLPDSFDRAQAKIIIDTALRARFDKGITPQDAVSSAVAYDKLLDGYFMDKSLLRRILKAVFLEYTITSTHS